MRIAVLSLLALAMMLTIAPAVIADVTDDCPRVGTYIERVDNLIERAAPLIRDSGNRRAMGMLESAIGEIQTAHRAYNAGNCRVALGSAQNAETLVHQALRLLHNRPLN